MQRAAAYIPLVITHNCTRLHGASNNITNTRARAGLKISVPKWPGKWVLGMDEYAAGVVGAKSRNLAGLRGKLPAWIALPASCTLPFGCFEEVRARAARVRAVCC